LIMPGKAVCKGARRKCRQKLVILLLLLENHCRL